MKRRALIVGLGVAALGLSGGAAHAIKRANMPAYCQGKVVATYAVPERRIKMRDVVKATDGSYSIDGTVRAGRKATEKFRCAFDVKGAFVGLLEVTGRVKP